jgi:hypothetical protein
VKRTFFAALCLATLTAPAWAAELPKACTDPTPEQKTNAQVRSFCKELLAIDQANAKLEESRQSLGQAADQAAKATQRAIDSLNRAIEQELKKK